MNSFLNLINEILIKYINEHFLKSLWFKYFSNFYHIRITFLKLLHIKYIKKKILIFARSLIGLNSFKKIYYIKNILSYSIINFFMKNKNLSFSCVKINNKKWNFKEKWIATINLIVIDNTNQLNNINVTTIMQRLAQQEVQSLKNSQ